jgi:hypothetical protein
MRSFDVQGFLTVLRGASPPCISLYQPTHRHHPSNQQDPIRFRNLTATLEESLRQTHDVRTVRALIEPFHQLGQDAEFWNHTLDGLAVLARPGVFVTFPLQREVPERLVVAGSFHTKPLLRIVQSADRFQVLCLGRNEVRLLEGNRDVLDEVELDPSVPQGSGDVDEAARRGREAAPAPEVEQAKAKGLQRSSGTGRRGRDSSDTVADLALERYFRSVDRAVTDHHSKPTGLPLLLAALPEHQPVFRDLSHNPRLLPQGIDRDPFPLDVDALRQSAWGQIAPYYLSRLASLVSTFQEAQSKFLGSSDASTVADAAVAGRVATILVEADRMVPGRVNAETGRISFEDLNEPEVDDLLDDLAELVLAKGGEVVVVPRESMPAESGLAAIFRH